VDLFVDQSNGDDAADGLAWATARESIGSAIATAETSPGPDVISVAAGRYVEQLVVPADTSLLGGYPPGGGPRDPAANPTILDGAGTFAPVVDFPPGSDGTVLEGFVVTGGWSDRASGGGIRVEDAAPLIRNNIIEGNTACGGSGILLDYSTSRPAARVEGNIIRESACWRIQFQCGCGSAVSISGPWDVDLGTVLSGNRITANMGGGVEDRHPRWETLFPLRGCNSCALSMLRSLLGTCSAMFGTLRPDVAHWARRRCIKTT